VCAARELSKRHEEVVVGPALGLAERFAVDPPRGEFVLVLDAVGIEGDAAGDRATFSRASGLVDAMVDAGMRRKDACRIAAAHEGVSSRDLYDAR
jgi:16S rRNA (cytidine1402-2'-O)-methyltransferase